MRKKEARFLSADQYRVLCVTADSWAERRPYLGAMVRVWTECCCRPQEVLALRVQDYADGIVSVRQTPCPVTKEPKPLKTEQTGAASWPSPSGWVTRTRQWS